MGLPTPIRGCLFDLDGVLTQTAKLHMGAWKEMFDAYLQQQAERSGELFVPFDPRTDYHRYVDGKPRADGTRAFLASRGIELPEGARDDPPERNTVHGLGARKNAIVRARIAREGVDTYPGATAYVQAVRAAGLQTAVVSSSANTRAVLQATRLEALFDVIIDADAATARGLAGKPAPDTFLAAAADLGLAATGAAVFEDALAGVAAGRAGGFGWVVGVDTGQQGDALRRAGADIVVPDLAALLPP